ncbi:MAG: hypothetical protein OXK16_13325 [bacterium]|nr:hypothetical protein [bacterium]MDE0287483.1 hypothetical protein [bacterium]MDE0376925.1 hypothetical protein [bacterium]
MGLFARHIRTQIEEAMDWARVIMIHGTRQSGKTTLAKMIAEDAGVRTRRWRTTAYERAFSTIR